MYSLTYQSTVGRATALPAHYVPSPLRVPVIVGTKSDEDLLFGEFDAGPGSE